MYWVAKLMNPFQSLGSVLKINWDIN